MLLSLEACSAREGMTAICSYDINEVSWRQVREKLVELRDHDQEVDWSDGHHFPWWVWLANTGNSVQGVYYISAKDSDGKMNVRGPQRLYRG